MLDILFFSGLVLYFAAMVLTFVGMVFKNEKITKPGWYVFMAGAAVSTAYLVYRGIVAGRLPLSNQFEFAASFSWGIAVILILAMPLLKNSICSGVIGNCAVVLNSVTGITILPATIPPVSLPSPICFPSSFNTSLLKFLNIIVVSLRNWNRSDLMETTI